ncbi:M28 family peptidase [Microvirga sp. STS02]|uniref:M28 family peptidase n=1 Tax=Hymenobacter negativus TaxID=2795026 RepID=UPI0018DCCAE0|nr:MULTISPECIES: M28 family peptidase [Bacteria]MBH8568972.1 M28 family peptidase [Hymenobacter negativus]MBR7208707.1 M28 family peptidase [Microvirga sp. STS02]
MKRPFQTTARLLLASFALATPLAAPAQKKPATKPANAESAIREADIKRDLFALADDHFRGREGGTLDELKASVWLADQIRSTGMLPAGDDGTYFQWFNLQRTRLSKSSTLRIGTHDIKLNEDGAVTAPTNASITAPLVYVGTGSAAELAKVDIKGKAVAVQISGAPTDGISYRRYVFGKFAGQAGELVKAGAVAVVFVSDAASQALYDHWSHIYERGRYSLPGAASTKVVSTPPVVWLPASAASWVQQAGQQFTTELKVESFQYPSVNIVAKMPGTDAQLKKEYVLFSTHQDHDGVRALVAGDSIYNGADDNATGCAALLAIMRAFKQQPGRRSALFVYQGSEERGLIGSTYFSAHPTVPQSSIVAVLNAEMMGRNAPDSAALLGSTPPHLNSSDLVKTALAANQAGPKFKLDTEWDKPTHPEGWYFRSDHLPYARLGIPAIMYTSLLHVDYHTPRDEARRIDYAKLTRMTQWMYLTGWAVANRTAPPAREPGFKLER